MVPISNFTNAKEPSAKLSQILMMDDPSNWVSTVAIKGNGNSEKNLTFRELGLSS